MRPILSGFSDYLPYLRAKLTVLMALALVIVHSTNVHAEPFPLDKFKAQIGKPLPMYIRFTLISTKSHSGLAPKIGSSRHYEVRFGGETDILLEEDYSNYTLDDIDIDWGNPNTEQFPANREDKLNLISGTSSGPYKQYWGLSGNQYWTLMNGNGVITRHMDAPASQGMDPKRVVDSQIGIAYDLLNLGVMDIGVTNIQWTTPLTFVHSSNLVGVRIEGALSVGADGRPSLLNLKLTHRGKDFHYQVRYGFSTSKEPLEWFPRQLKIVLLSRSGGEETVVSDYQVEEVHLAETVPDRMVTNFDGLRHFASPQFVFTNETYYAIQQVDDGVEPILIPFKIPQNRWISSRRWGTLTFLFSITILGGVIWHFIHKNRQSL